MSDTPTLPHEHEFHFVPDKEWSCGSCGAELGVIDRRWVCRVCNPSHDLCDECYDDFPLHDDCKFHKVFVYKLELMIGGDL